MVIGVPREIHRHEHRVGMTPFAAARLVRDGHEVVVEAGAGETAHFSDEDYKRAGARVVYDPDAAYLRADLVCRVGVLAPGEIPLLKPGSAVCAFHHLAVASRETVERLMERGITLIGYELVRDEVGDLPVKRPFSEMAGQMAVHIAAHHLQNEAGGRGILLGSVPGIPPPTVVILGAGAVGRSAAGQAADSGAHVLVLDEDLSKLRELHREVGGRAVTVPVAEGRLERYTRIADVLIGAVLVPGARAPFLVTEDMVRDMKPGSVVIDVAIDQGGCVETSRPTTLDDPTFIRDGVVHYCVPNMTANIARTASRALAHAGLPFVSRLASGVDDALRADPGLAAGVYLYRGSMVQEPVAEALGIEHTPISELLGGS